MLKQYIPPSFSQDLLKLVYIKYTFSKRWIIKFTIEALKNTILFFSFLIFFSFTSLSFSSFFFIYKDIVQHFTPYSTMRSGCAHVFTTQICHDICHDIDRERYFQKGNLNTLIKIKKMLNWIKWWWN